MKIIDLLLPAPTRQDLVDFCAQLNTPGGEGVRGEQSVLKFLQRRYGKELQQFSFNGLDVSGLNFFRASFKDRPFNIEVQQLV